MLLRDPVEIFYLTLMHRWQETAPLDKHHDLLDGQPEQNSQDSRPAYELNRLRET